MFAVMIAALVLSSLIIVWVVTVFLRPVHHIVARAREIAAGERVRRIHVPAHDEMGTLAESLNDMLEALNRAKAEIQQYCATLEERVKERTHELVEEKEKYETLVERAPLIVYRMEGDGTTVYVNQKVEDILGYSPAEVIADKDFWTKIVHHWERQTVARELSTCLAEAKEFMLEYCGIHKSGHEVFLLNHATPVVDTQGRLLAVDGIIVDVSQGKRLQEQIIQTEELRTLSNISARLAHEIRNPLTSAGGFARRLLQEMEENDPQRKKVEIIVQEVARLEQILKMILSYLRPVILEFSEVDLNELLEEAIKCSEEKFSRHDVQVELSFDPALPSVRADRGRLRHALEVLLRNACNHMPKQSRLLITTGWNGAVVVTLSYPALHLAGDDMDHFFYPFMGGVLGEEDLEVPMTKVVIHKHGGIIDIERNDQDRLIITITFAPLGQDPEREIHRRLSTVH
jgi:PAS domain S-box-containing protein